MRRKTAKEILAESFREIAEKKNIDKITVREIADNCGYSTATFYRHFRDKYDLVVWDYTERISEIMGNMDSAGKEWRQTLIEGAMFFNEQKEFLANLLLHTNGYDSFIKNMTDINAVALKEHILKRCGKTEPVDEIEKYIRLYAHGTVGLTSEWILGRYDITPDEMADIYENSLPLPLHKYLK